MKFNNIKRLLRQQIESGVRVLWTFNEAEPEFTMIIGITMVDMVDMEVITIIGMIMISGIKNQKLLKKVMMKCVIIVETVCSHLIGEKTIDGVMDVIQKCIMAREKLI